LRFPGSGALGVAACRSFARPFGIAKAIAIF
jgi:hypothetical protein